MSAPPRVTLASRPIMSLHISGGKLDNFLRSRGISVSRSAGATSRRVTHRRQSRRGVGSLLTRVGRRRTARRRPRVIRQARRRTFRRRSRR